MKIAVFGSTGFVGSNFINKFNNQDYILFNRNNINDFKLFTEDKNVEVVLNFIGKAHDLKKSNNIDEYYNINNIFCTQLFDAFLRSEAKIFITLSSVKAVADNLTSILLEDHIPKPITHYGKSKLLAEKYILSKDITEGKKVYILRPCMIHGPGNKGNLNLLYKIVKKGFPWPLGSFNNKRSFCSIDNLCFIIKEIIENDKIPSGIYNIADDEHLSTNEIIDLIAKSQQKKIYILNVSKFIINIFSKLGDLLGLPLNTERLNKLTETYIVSNNKIKNAINKPLPMTAQSGLLKTFNSFNNSNIY